MTDEMKKELLSRADSILDAVGKAVATATDFAATQIPDIAYQYLAFGRAQLTFYIVVATFLIVYGVYVLVKQLKSIEIESDELIAGIGGVFTGTGIVVYANHLSDFLLVWFAPKVWLIKEIANMLK